MDRQVANLELVVKASHPTSRARRRGVQRMSARCWHHGMLCSPLSARRDFSSLFAKKGKINPFIKRNILASGEILNSYRGIYIYVRSDRTQNRTEHHTYRTRGVTNAGKTGAVNRATRRLPSRLFSPKSRRACGRKTRPAGPRKLKGDLVLNQAGIRLRRPTSPVGCVASSAFALMAIEEASLRLSEVASVAEGLVPRLCKQSA